MRALPTHASATGLTRALTRRYFDKHLPQGMRRPKCKVRLFPPPPPPPPPPLASLLPPLQVGSFEVELQSGGGGSYKANLVTGIAEFESAAVAEAAVAGDA